MCLTLFTPRVKNVKIGALPTKSVGQQNANGKNAPDVCRALASLFFFAFCLFFCFLFFVFCLLFLFAFYRRTRAAWAPSCQLLMSLSLWCMYVCMYADAPKPTATPTSGVQSVVLKKYRQLSCVSCDCCSLQAVVPVQSLWMETTMQVGGQMWRMSAM